MEAKGNGLVPPKSPKGAGKPQLIGGLPAGGGRGDAPIVYFMGKQVCPVATPPLPSIHSPPATWNNVGSGGTPQKQKTRVGSGFLSKVLASHNIPDYGRMGMIRARPGMLWRNTGEGQGLNLPSPNQTTETYPIYGPGGGSQKNHSRFFPVHSMLKKLTKKLTSQINQRGSPRQASPWGLIFCREARTTSDTPRGWECARTLGGWDGRHPVDGLDQPVGFEKVPRGL